MSLYPPQVTMLLFEPLFSRGIMSLCDIYDRFSEQEAQMRRYRTKVVEDSEIFIGVDVHLRQWHVTVRTLDEELISCSIPGSWLAFERLLSRYRGCSVQVVYEAGFSGYWLYDRVTAWGASCLVTAPSLVPMAYGNRVKTDKRDSRKLSWLLSRQLLKSIWVPDEAQRGHREVLRRRRQLVQDRTRLQSRIKAQLALQGLSVSSGPGRWTGRLLARLRQVRFPDPWTQASFERLLALHDLLSEQLASQTSLLRQLSDSDHYREPLRLVTSIPGIGLITGMALLVELGDVRRFGRADHLAAYLGLTPSQYSSGDHIRMGRITGMGNRYLRGLLVEAAWITIRHDANLRQVYQRIKGRAGGRRAIVAVARRLALLVRRLLIDQSEYQCQAAV